MSRLQRKLSPFFSATLTHPRTRGARRRLAEVGRRVLMKSGLWGVPSFRLLGEGGEPDFCTWGQGRLWLVEEILRRRAPRGPAVSSA